MGGYIPGGNFLGWNFLGVNSLGGSLIGGDFPGGSFTDTNKNKSQVLYNKTWRSFLNTERNKIHKLIGKNI